MLKNTFQSGCIAILSMSLLFINTSLAENKTKKLVGKIDAETGQYTAGDKSFRVTIPITGTPAYVLNSVTDSFTARGSLLSIRPTENGGTYRLEITHALDENQRRADFAQASATTFDWYRRLATRSYRSPLVELSTFAFKLGDKQSSASIYKQFATDQQGPRFHLFYLTDFGDELAFVWTDIPLEAENIDAEESIINGNAEQVKKSIAMLQSLTFE